MQALVLAAGRGTRMRGLCNNRPKALLPVANRPAIRLILDGLADAGVTRAHVVIGHRGEEVRAHFARHPHRLGPLFIEQPTPDGTGSAARLGRDALAGGPFVLAFADILVSPRNYAALLRAHAARPDDALLAVRKVPDPCHGAAVYLEGDRVVRIVEKPPPGSSTTDLDNAGLFVLPPDVFRILDGLQRSPRGEYELTDALAVLAEQHRLRAHRLEGYWFNLTDPETLLAANAAVLAEGGMDGDDGGGPTDDGRETMDDRRRHLPPTDSGRRPRPLHGPVALGADCRIGRAELGPNVSLGDGCRVGDGARLADAVVMEGVDIGPGAVVERAVVAPGVRIGRGARAVGTADHVAVVLGDVPEGAR